MSRRTRIALCSVCGIILVLALPYMSDAAVKVKERVQFMIEAARQQKIFDEKRTVFGITLGQELPKGEFEPARLRDEYGNPAMELLKTFDTRAIASEYSLSERKIKLLKPFLGAEIATVLVSQNDSKVRGIALCYGFDTEHGEKEVDDFGRAEKLREEMSSLLEERFDCKMMPYPREPTFVKRFVRPLSFSDKMPSGDGYYYVVDEHDLVISPKSCFSASKLLFASIFVLRSDEAYHYIGNNYTSDVRHRTKVYLILLIQDPYLDMEREQKLIKEKSARESKSYDERKRREALDAL